MVGTEGENDRMRSRIIRPTLCLLIFSFQVYSFAGESVGTTRSDGPIKEIATGGRLISTAWAPLDESYWFASRDKYLYRYHMGEENRRARLEDRPLSKLVEGPDGKLYLFLENRALQAVCPGGIAAWSYPLDAPPLGAPVIGPEGSIFVTTRGKKLLSISPSGSLRWELSLPAEPVSNPLLFTKDKQLALAVPCESGRTYAFLLDGSRLWQFVSADTAVSPLAEGSHIYLPTRSATVTGVNSSGILEWELRLESPVRLSSLGGFKGERLLFLVDEESRVYCLDGKDGSLLWKVSPGKTIASIASSGDFLILSPYEGGLIWLDREGELFDQLETDLPSAAISIAPGGTVLFGGKNWIFSLYPSKIGTAAPLSMENTDSSTNSFAYTIIEEIAGGIDLQEQLLTIEEIREDLEKGEAPVPPYLPEALEVFASAGVFSTIRQDGRVLNDFPEVRIEAINLLSRYGRASSSATISRLLSYEWDRSVRIAGYQLLGSLLSDPNRAALSLLRERLSRIYRSADAQQEVSAASNALIRISSYHGGPFERDIELLLGVAYGPFSRNLRSKVLNTLRQGKKIRLY